MDGTESLKLEVIDEGCMVCGAHDEELYSVDEHDAAAPAHLSLRAMLLALNNHKVVPNGRLCTQCVRRTIDAYNFTTSLGAKTQPSLSEKINSLRKKLHELTKKIDVFIVVGGNPGGTYSEEDIIMVERSALTAAADTGQPPRAVDARGEPVYQCTVCPETFERVSLLRSHSASHGSSAIHNCWTCGAQFPSASAAHDHARDHAPADLVCHACDTTFQSSSELRRHEPGCTVCPECGERHASRSALLSHARGHAARCGVCLARVPRAERAEHRLRHASHARYVCGYDACILRFVTRANLLAHIRKCHGVETAVEEDSPATTTLACTSCDRTFASVAALKRHSRVHRGERQQQTEVQGNMEIGDEDGRIEYLEVETLEDFEDSQ